MKRLGFGCGSVMGRVGRRASLLAMHAAWDAGITLFDTARSYGYGEAEALLGEFLVGHRTQATVVTKFGIVPRAQPAWRRAAKPLVRAALHLAPSLRGTVRRGLVNDLPVPVFDVRTMQQSLEQSLRALRTDYVDVLLAHEAPASVMAQEDLMAALEALVASGKVLRVGVSGSQAVAEEVVGCGPELLSVVQFPAPFSAESAPELSAAGARLRIANHLFGGPDQARALREQLSKMAADSSLTLGLRQKLHAAPELLLAELVFAAAPADWVVASMLQPAHVAANVQAIISPRFSVEEIAALRAKLAAGL